MHITTSLLALAALCPSILAQSQSAGQRSLLSKDGYTTTRIFAPFFLGAGHIVTAIGSEGPTTTWSVPTAVVTGFTLGPNTAINTFSFPFVPPQLTRHAPANLPNRMPQTFNGTLQDRATRIINCAYTPSSGAQAVTAECLTTMQYVNRNATTNAYATTTYPRPASETTQLAGYNGKAGEVTAWDGMIDVYVATTDGQVVTGTKEGGEVVTSAVGGGIPQVTAMVQAVVVVAAGAAAMAI